MRLRADQLTSHLQQSLKPVYLVFGDEQMLVEETSDLIRQQARAQGATERESWQVEGRFDWSQIRWQEQALSLFASKKLVEIRLPSGSPGKQGGEILREFAEAPPEDTVLLIISGKIDNRSQKAKWFTAIDNLGITIPIWPINQSELPRWISQRLQQKGLSADITVANMIAERVEGNLFAAAQEVDKLQLLCSDGMVDLATAVESVADNARFEAFGLMDAVLLGQTQKIPRMIKRLKDEGIEVLSVFSAVSWSLHRLIDIASQTAQGTGLEQAFSSQKPPVWDKQKTIMRTALQRYTPLQWQQFLPELAHIDQAAKGSLNQCPWTLLEQLCLSVAGAQHQLKMS
jgi:DNA polymerase-3 subunit delta